MSTSPYHRSRALLIALTTYALLLEPIQGMDNVRPSMGILLKLGQTEVVRFRTPEEMITYGQTVLDHSNNKRFDSVHTLATREFLFDFKADNFSELEERFSYFVNHSLGQAYYHFGKQNSLNPEASMQHFMQAIMYEEKYLMQHMNCARHNKWVIPHRVTVCKAASDICIKLAEFAYTPLVHTDMQINQFVTGQLIKSANYLLQALKFIPEATTLGTHEFLLTQQSLFSTYIRLIPLCLNPHAKKDFRKRATAIIQDVRKTRHDDAPNLVQRMEKEFAVIGALAERERIGQKIGGPKKIREKRVQNFQKIDAHLHDLEDEVNAQITTSSCDAVSSLSRPFVLNACFQIQALANNHEALRVRENIKALEEKISLALSQSKADVALVDIYEQICVFVGLKDLIELRNSIMMAGIESGNMREALERVIVLTQLELRKQGNISTLTRFLQASLKSLCGDSSEWIAYEEERIREAQAKKRAAQLRNDTQIRTEIERSRNAPEERKTPENKLPSNQGQSRKVMETALSAADIPQESNLVQIPNHLAKEKKIRNHEEAERLRAEKRSALDETDVPTPEIELKPKKKIKEELKLPLIRDLYVLTSGARKVDLQIENGTWKFTREKLIAYFEALGCNPEEGGKHKKVPLPPAIKIMHNGVLISVINDLGGALTLPRWDKSTNNGCVPDYLREQILVAREKLVLLALKAEREKAAIALEEK